MRTRDRRGSVLLLVLMGALVCGVIIATLVHLQMQPALDNANLVDRIAKGKLAEASINAVSAAWSAAGSTCSSSASAGVSCRGSGCSCDCTVQGLPPVLSRPGSGLSCQLTAASE